MYHWSSRFQAIRPMESMPQILTVASETVVSPAYHHRGIDRSREAFCIYKHTLKGEGAFRDATGEHRVTEGHGFLSEIADPETAYYYPENCREPWIFVWIAFQGVSAKAMVRDMVKRHGHIYSFAPDAPELMRIQELRKYDGKVHLIAPAAGARIVTDLLLALAASMEEQGGGAAEHVLIRRARELLTEKIGERLNATELARHLQVSREHLTRKFKAETAMTPHEYILRRKLIYACHLLKETAMSSKEISLRVGFDHPAHFTRTFRRAIHMTPTRFRSDGIMPVS